MSSEGRPGSELVEETESPDWHEAMRCHQGN